MTNAIHMASASTPPAQQNSPYSDLQTKIRQLAGNAIEDAMLTKIEGFITDQMGKELPGNASVKDAARLTKKQAGVTHAVTSVSSDGITIDGFLIHVHKIGAGAHSIVKSGLLISKPDNEWKFEPVAIHKVKKTQPLESTASQIKPPVYLPRIELHEKLFKGATHPHVESKPKYYGWLDSDREYMVHELRKGDIKRKPCTTSKQLILVAIQIISALDFYHKNDVLFRDLKTDNILIDAKDQAILSDPMEVKEGEATTCAGSVPYFPIDFMDSPKQTKAWDLYALGVTLLDTKYGYIKKAFDSIPDSSPDFFERKRKLGIEAVATFSHTNILLKDLKDRKVPKHEMVPTLHFWNQSRVPCRLKQDDLIRRIFNAGGFKDEDLGLVQKRLAFLDIIIEKLLDKDPQERPPTAILLKAFT